VQRDLFDNFDASLEGGESLMDLNVGDDVGVLLS
jgi:hypothetical protein